jgi:hypothetical protein
MIKYLCILFFLFAFTSCGADTDEGATVQVYFFDAAAGEMRAEERAWPGAGAWQGAMLGYIMRGPSNARLSATWPAEMEGQPFWARFENEVFTLWVTDAFLDAPPLSQTLFRMSLSMTLNALPFVSEVYLVVLDDIYNEVAHFAHTGISNNPPITATRLTTAQFTLFVPDEYGLTYVTREATDIEQHIRDRVLMEMLIEANPTIPADTHVHDVIHDADAGAVYVDFSGEFHRNFSGGAAHAHMMLMSIVHTVIENTPGPGTRRVFFLIDSERREDFHGVTDFHLGFTTIDAPLPTDPEEYETDETDTTSEA